jgi:hypothetical protein
MMNEKEETSRVIFGVCRADCLKLHTLTTEQERVLDEFLRLTDELDKIHDAHGGAAPLSAAAELAEAKFQKIVPSLPHDDLRTALLDATISAYRDCTVLAVAAELNQYDGDATPTVAVARMRKVFLRKLLGGELDSEAQTVVDYLVGGETSTTSGGVMHTKIPLPSVTRTLGAKAHPYPLQVSMQTQEFIQAVLFYGMFADTAAGTYVRQPDALKTIEERLSKEGLDKKTWDTGWEYLGKYGLIFNNTLYQNIVILMRSHWDWYVRQIGEFVRFARNHVPSPTLDREQTKNLKRLGFLEIGGQLTTLEESCGISFNIPTAVLLNLDEMSYVRNLGMHNRWEVDEFYLKKTSSKSQWEVKDVRLVETAELQSWAASLSELINGTCFEIATVFLSAPDFP